MEKWLFFILSAVIFIPLHSCLTVDIVNIDIRKPAHATFEPGTSKVIIVDNSFKPKAPTDSLGIVPAPIALRNFLIDSIRPRLLDNMAQYMSSDGLFDTVEVYPYYPRPLYIYYENDSLLELPLTKEEIQDICYQTDADALISLDFIDIRISRISKVLFLTESTYIIRNYSAMGDSLAVPIINTDTATLFEQNGGISNLCKYLLYENTIYLADRLVDSFIPKWETQERVLFNESPYKALEAFNPSTAYQWSEAFNFWKEDFNNTNNKKKKLRCASNMALMSEYMDDVELAQKWINAANDLLSDKDNDELAKYIRFYKGIIDERVKNAPLLKKQLDLSIEEDISMDSQ